MICSRCGNDVPFEGEVCHYCFGNKAEDQDREFERRYESYWEEVRQRPVTIATGAVMCAGIGALIDRFVLESFPFATIGLVCGYLLAIAVVWLVRPRVE